MRLPMRSSITGPTAPEESNEDAELSGKVGCSWDGTGCARARSGPLRASVQNARQANTIGVTWLSKYQPLTDYLGGAAENAVELSFTDTGLE